MTDDISSRGPLAGLRVIEFTGIGPGPHCAMLLADLGADVLRIDRPGGNGWFNPVVDRGRAALTVDLRSDAGRDRCLDLIAHADVVIEGNRPGVMERLGLGPDACLARNPRLVYGRMTGWGQTGPLAKTAGHDINYIGLTGALAAMGRPGEPAAVPLNLVGDFGGGSLYLAFGIMSALWERERSGKGQVVDAAIVDGVSSQMTFFAGLVSAGRISLDRRANLLGGAAPWYRTYLCRDGKEMAVGAIEPQFYAEMIRRLDQPAFAECQNDRARWDEMATAFAAVFASQDRDHWTALFAGSDACVTPVLEMDEAARDPHLAARATYAEAGGTVQAVPAPRFSRTPGALPRSGDAATMIARWTAAD